jgi:hypothetical protein
MPSGLVPEHERVLVVVEGIEHHHDRVGLVERRVAPRLRHDDLRRIAVERDNAHIDVAVADDDANLGLFSGRRAFNRILLREARIRLHRLPDRIIHAAVDGWAFGRRIELGGGECRNLGSLGENRDGTRTAVRNQRQTASATGASEYVAGALFRMIKTARKCT